MKKKYELWLDESGDFEDESKKKRKKNNGIKPSLIGGILIEQDKKSSIDFDKIIKDDEWHANEIDKNKKAKVVIGALETLRKDYEAIEVFFENSEYEDEASNRLLYLRIMAEGLLQLMQTLSAENESVELKVIIAQRQDISSMWNSRINEEEYKKTLEDYIERKKKEHKIFFVSDTKLDFEIKPAYNTKELMLADYACNTRLTRDSKAFMGYKDKLGKLYSDAYIFTLHEVGLENGIKRCLSGSRISDAVMELYLYINFIDDKHNIFKENMLLLIEERMSSMSYRIIKSQLNQCKIDIGAYIANVRDFESGEAFLKDILNSFIPLIEKKEHSKEKYPVSKFKFALLLLLSDMYLREGDINSAGDTLKLCRDVYNEAEDTLEDVLPYYQLLEKESLLAIDCFDYDSGIKIMEDACCGFKFILENFKRNLIFEPCIKQDRSEYYGDALCMLIYAKMFLQRDNPDSYNELKILSDTAMKQYIGPESELERHRQYRAHIEAEAGRYDEAVIWLFKAKVFYKESINEQSLIEFLDNVYETEEETSCRYYFMYYLHIMSEAVMHKENNLSNMMYKAALAQKRMMRLCGLMNEYKSITKTNEVGVNVNSVSEPDTGISYHPEEIIYWKYASYLYNAGMIKEAKSYFNNGINLCQKHQEYYTMYITGFGITAEYICYLIDTDEISKAVKMAEQLRMNIASISTKILNKKTQKFLNNILRITEDGLRSNGEINKNEFLKIARCIAY